MQKAEINGRKKKLLSDMLLNKIRKRFWPENSDKVRYPGRLSWGRLSQLLKELDLKLSYNCINHIYQLTDQHRYGSITFYEFISSYFVHEVGIEPLYTLELVTDLSAKKLHLLRLKFYDQSRLRNGRMSRISFIETILSLGVVVDDA